MVGKLIKRYIDALKAGIRIGKERKDPRIIWPLIVFLSIAILSFAFAISFHPEGYKQDYHFRNENGLFTSVSMIFLAAGSALAFTTGVYSDQDKKSRLWWFLMAAALLFLALDETMGFHESVGDYIDGHPLVKHFLTITPIRRANDAILIGYGLGAIGVGFVFLPELVKHPRPLMYLCIGFVFFVVHTSIDALVEPPTTPSYIIEETCKLLCNIFLAYSGFAGLMEIHNPKIMPGGQIQINSD